MKTWSKELSLLLVGMMMMSGLVALSAPAVVANTEMQEDGCELLYVPAYMNEEAHYFAEVGGNVFNLGEGDGVDDDIATALTLTVTVVDIDVDDLTDFWLNITDYDDAVFDFQDMVPGTTGCQVADGPYDITTPTQVFAFDFDILATSFPTESQRTLELSWDYIEVDSAAVDPNVNRNGNVDIVIEIWSIFNDGTNHDTLSVLPNLLEVDEDPVVTDDARFEAGDTFAATELDIHNYDAADGITDVTCTIVPPTGGLITFTNDIDYCTIPAGVAAGAVGTLNYRTEVAAQTPPGFYEGVAEIVYTRGDLVITEAGHLVEWAVDFSFIDQDPYTPPQDADSSWSPFQLQATSVEIVDSTRQVNYDAPYTVPMIDQSMYTDQMIRVNITVHNNGNTALYNVQFAVAPGSGFYPGAGVGWDFFRNPRFWWADVSAPGGMYDSISQTFAFIDVDDSVTLSVDMVVAANIPIGVHRLPLTYDGFYFNGGELDEATGFEPICGFDGVPLDGDANADDLTVVFAIEVADQAISCHVVVPPAAAGNKLNIIAETITVTIVNDELYAFIDVMVQANFTNTPWYNPIIGMNGDQLVWANQANPSIMLANWAPGVAGQQALTFTVDTNPNMTPDTYPFQLEITAVIEQTLEVVTMTVDWTQGATLYYAGYGPNITITAFTAEDIVPGQEFELVLNLTNVGDETLRDVSVFIPVDGTQPANWSVEQIFKEQFNYEAIFEDWGGSAAGGVTWNGEFPEDIFYTVEDLDVDNIREIYEINLYVDGIYSRPSAKIAMIHIIDLGPGATTTVTFDMFTDKDMVNGKPYDMTVQIVGLGPEGTEYQTFNRQITVMSSIPGESYNPVELNWFDAGLKALALFLFFIIVLAILLFVYNMFKGEPYDEDEEDFDFEDEDSFESAPAEEKKEGLVEP